MIKIGEAYYKLIERIVSEAIDDLMLDNQKLFLPEDICDFIKIVSEDATEYPHYACLWCTKPIKDLIYIPPIHPKIQKSNETSTIILNNNIRKEWCGLDYKCMSDLAVEEYISRFG